MSDDSKLTAKENDEIARLVAEDYQEFKRELAARGFTAIEELAAMVFNLTVMKANVVLLKLHDKEKAKFVYDYNWKILNNAFDLKKHQLKRKENAQKPDEVA